MNTKSHRQKPDLDNLIKSTLDALDKDNDSYVWQIYAEKYWAKEGAIEIEELQ